jgi:lipopolysaccharide/colanic/teichoic acid biosynthesis glycosyltransferase
MKRTMDLVGASAALVVLGPSIVAIAVAVRRTMGGPVLYRQVRVGRHGRPFVMPKFRTMAQGRGSSTTFTVAHDPRVTRVGRALRRTRLDVLPQLWCVVRGEMSLVGPRPDVPGYADLLEGEDRRILELRPGITGPATIAFRDEESLLASVPDPRRYNDEVVFPAKTRLNLAYSDQWSVRGDCLYLLATLHPVFERWLPGAERASARERLTIA